MPLPNPYAYVFCIHFNTPGANYAAFNAEIQKSPTWWHYLPNTYILLRFENIMEMQTLFTTLIYPDDRMLILPAKGPAVGWLPKEAFDWFNQNVPREF